MVVIKMKSITLVNLHFGTFKNYFPLFLNGCKNNPTVNFLIVTDQKIISPAPNVIIKNMTFEECKTKIQELFDFPINLKSPYDLCDYKVVYGELFSEELAGSDFWRYCDTDLIFGDIRKFITDNILQKYEKVLIRGHFTLFRNLKDINAIYRNKLPDGEERFKQVFSEDGVHHFDEGMPQITKGINHLFDNAIGWDRVYDKYVFMDLCVSSFSFINADFINDKEELKKSEHSYFLYDNGKLFRVLQNGNREEFMYIHFQKRNMKIKNVDGDSQGYYIIPNKFVSLNGISQKRLLGSNNQKIYWSKLFERINGKLKRTFGAVFK